MQSESLVAGPMVSSYEMQRMKVAAMMKILPKGKGKRTLKLQTMDSKGK